ncbi:hypothetical protein ACFPAG_01140 [Vogesella sp. GCM10023246]|uniref:Transmembrane protein n=1 Tax=Vogesella oryzagri TaxID=3160864 RepID=A0ABV1LZT1_9NEIS
MNEQAASRTILKLLSVAVSLLAIISLLPWLFVALFSIMLFDSPRSTGSFITWMLFYSIWAYPGGVLFGAKYIFGNKAQNAQQYFIGIGLTILPAIISVCLFFAVDIFCAGKFSC